MMTPSSVVSYHPVALHLRKDWAIALLKWTAWSAWARWLNIAPL